VTPLGDGARPALARGVRLRLDRISGKTLLLRPEQGFELRGSALDVVQLCDGRRSVADIVDALAARATGTARAEIADDVRRLLGDLHQRGVVDIDADPQVTAANPDAGAP
jgi:pyrroloquinoline quinone biosynthesis protein D